jgi:hypothetical protein
MSIHHCYRGSIFSKRSEMDSDGWEKKRYIQRYAETIPKLRFPPLSSLALRPKIEANEESGSCIDWSVALPGR